MKKTAYELPSDIAKWEDAIIGYIDKHYSYLGNGISNVSFSTKDESTKDGIGAVQYKNGGIEMIIPIIIDNGKLKEPDIGIHGEQIIPIDEDMINWINSNDHHVGSTIDRGSQHIHNMDYLKQTGLFEEPEGGGYVKTSCRRDTIERIRKHAGMYPETKWLSDALSTINKYAAETFIAGSDLVPEKTGGIYSKMGEYVTTGIDGIPKIASDYATLQLIGDITKMPKATPIGKVAKLKHGNPIIDVLLKKAESDKGDSYVRVVDSNTYGGYENVVAMDGGVMRTYYGSVKFDVKPIHEDNSMPIAMMIVEGEHKGSVSADIAKMPKNRETFVRYTGDPEFDEQAAILGDIYGNKISYHSEKKGTSEDNYRDIYPRPRTDINMGDNVMIRLDEKSTYSIPYRVDNMSSGLIGSDMKNVSVLTLASLLDGSRFDVIVTEIDKLTKIKKSEITNRHLESMLRSNNNTVYLVPNGSIFRAPTKVLTPAKKEDMISKIIEGMPEPEATISVEKTGSKEHPVVNITYEDGGNKYNYTTQSTKIASAILRQIVGDDIYSVPITDSFKIAVDKNSMRGKMRKVAAIVEEHTSDFIGAAAKLPRSLSRQFAKAASVSNVVDELIGVSFVDDASTVNTDKVTDQAMELINSLGNLILLSRMGKTAIPESEISRAFWAIAKMVKTLRG